MAELAKDPDALFIATGRTRSNEDSFEWVAPVYTDETWLLQVGDPPKDLQSLQHIGVRMGSPFAGEAARHGWSYAEITDWQSLTRTLLAGRLDAVYATRAVLESNVIPRLPATTKMTKFVMERMSWWIVRDKGFPETELMRRFRVAAESFQQSDEFKQGIADFEAVRR